MQPKDTYTSHQYRYSLGIDQLSGHPYLSYPVTTGVVDYEEFYRLSDDEYRSFLQDPNLAIVLLDLARKHEQDDRLFQKPGWNRGIPI